MALIRKSDIEEVRSRTNIAEIIGDYVTLKPAGVGSVKGLCPFHDERTPSFNVRPSLGFYHCFGCGESGDVFTFLQRIDHISFAEAAERLAARIGFTLSYEDGGTAPDHSRRTRLLAANAEAERFFRARLAAQDAEPARRFLGERGFGPDAARHFAVGYAPDSWDALSGHLRAAGFSEQELRDAGLVSTSDRGSSYDRFRGRLMWPIRDTTGQTVGFGARKLLETDPGPKYLNTPETQIYRKQQVLYGLDLAKRDIARERRVVVVEGYTDVMAAHLAGVTTAVATCGTAFGAEHIKVLRRIMDDESHRGRVVFTFDPDEAGRKAAMRAFAEEGRFVAQTYVAVAPEGLDPCDLRLERGDEAVRELVERPAPMYEFVIKQHLLDHDLETVEGRAAALRDTAPVVASIRDRITRDGYARQLARWTGVELREVQDYLRYARRRLEQARPEELPADQPGADDGGFLIPSVRLRDLPQDPASRLEQQAMSALLQYPGHLDPQLLELLLVAGFADASLATVRDAVLTTRESMGTNAWLARLAEEVPAGFRTLVMELAMSPLQVQDDDDRIRQLVNSLTAALVERDLLRRKAELMGRLQRTDARAEPERHRELSAQLMQIERAKRQLRPE